MLDANNFKSIRIGLATEKDILSWSKGEVKKPETINYRTLKPERDGLFGEQIFGPAKDWECACGRYKHKRYDPPITCEVCEVEVNSKSVRRERMGHIKLAAPVTHIWYYKGVPSRLGYLLNITPKDLDKVIYFTAYMITFVDEDLRHERLPELEAELHIELKNLAKNRDFAIGQLTEERENELAKLEEEGSKADDLKKTNDKFDKLSAQTRKQYDEQIDRLERVFETFKTLKVGELKADDELYQELEDRYGGEYFEGYMGAEAIKKRLEDLDLEAESAKLNAEIIEDKNDTKVEKAMKRLRVVEAFRKSGTPPEAMVLDAIPVIPPDLRPMVQLDGGRFATSDLNDLYRRVINRNNRLRKMMDLGTPNIIINSEKRMLQEAVDALFDNGRRGRAVTGTGNRALKSLSDLLKGKQGRFRQNLLGKRVDYSGRSVIVVGPNLKLHQCGLPKQMALELFKPFVIKQLMQQKYAQNIKAAKRMVERNHPHVWDVIEDVIQDRPVLLNRAPTLHRLGIQAFEPLLIEGKAIQLHPLVCTAFNADFDGDQMAVHLPLSEEAQAEARLLMLASNNILKPSDGRPITLPTQDMIIGLYHLTSLRSGAKGEGSAFSSLSEALMAKDLGHIDLFAEVSIRIKGYVESYGSEPETRLVKTTLGRALFNEVLPVDYPYYHQQADRDALSTLVTDLTERYPKSEVAATLDRIKEAGFHWATRSGVTMAMSELVEPKDKAKIVAGYEKKAAAIQTKVSQGLLGDDEGRRELIKIWEAATKEVAVSMQESFPEDSSVLRMVISGARGNWGQIRNISGIRGLVTNPRGETIARPILSSYRDGLSVAEYFIATHGARKGSADTALKTAESGYLTRRLVDVAQDIIIREEDCGTTKGLVFTIAARDSEPGPIERLTDATWGNALRDDNGRLVRDPNVERSVLARNLAEDVLDKKGNVVATRNTDITTELVEKMLDADVETVKVRSVLTSEAVTGVSAFCYGRSLAAGKQADLGEAIGIIAAQSIGEPGTQLTMRTFQAGGSASAADITRGLPRVTELFEARRPKNASPLAEKDGKISIEDVNRGRRITLTPDNGDDEISVIVSSSVRLFVEDGQSVKAGHQYHEGDLDPKDVLRILGERAVQRYLVDGVQAVYAEQSVPIHDKHIEVIVRQMLKKTQIVKSGDTDMVFGDWIDNSVFLAKNREAVLEGKTPATGRKVLLGITKASLKTNSWLSAASFQETTKVLTEAAVNRQSDPLVGLKENVIIGKLIPAGTGLDKYRNVDVQPTAEAFEELRSGHIDSLLSDDLSFEAIDLSSYDDGSDTGSYS